MPIGDIYVSKAKAAQFFLADKLATLKDVVSIVHDITSVATFFVKHYYLQHVYPAWRAAAGNGEAFPTFNLDTSFIGQVFSLVKRGKIQHRGVEPKPAALIELENVYNATPYFANDLKANGKRYKKFSLSHVLDYSAEQLETAYKNNVIANFSGYVKRFVVDNVRLVFVRRHAVTKYDQVPQDVRRAADKQANDVFNAIVERRALSAIESLDPDVVQLVEGWPARLLPAADPRFPTFDDHLEGDPFAFVPYMVLMNLHAEDRPNLHSDTLPNKLYNTFPLRKSFVPGSCTLDTTAMLHIFVDDVQLFKNWYAGHFETDLVNLHDKKDIAASFSTLVGRSTTAEEDALHAERCWCYVTTADARTRIGSQHRMVKKRNLERRDVGAGQSSASPPAGASKGKKSKEEKKAAKLVIAAKAIRDPNDYEDKVLRFQRMVVTDAYSISVLLTTATDKRGRVFGARKTRTTLATLDPDTAPSLQHLLDTERYSHAAMDPGKKELLWMTNGEKTLRYTYARRDRECRFRQVRLATEDKKRHWFCNGLVLPGLDPATGEPIPCCPTIEDVETKFLCSVTSKSCKLDRFDAYLQARERVQVHLKAFYCQTFFRSSKYSVYLAKKSSEDKLVDRIRNTFAEEGKALVIFWGNWGRLPNRLRNGPSTPGIGLRRFIHRRLSADTRNKVTYFGTTLTVFEGYTSSVCNACGGAVQNVVGANGEKKHRVLQCQAAQCNKTWQRDNLGSRNILMQAMHLLRHGSYHPWLRRNENA